MRSRRCTASTQPAFERPASAAVAAPAGPRWGSRGRSKAGQTAPGAASAARWHACRARPTPTWLHRARLRAPRGFPGWCRPSCSGVKSAEERAEGGDRLPGTAAAAEQSTRSTKAPCRGAIGTPSRAQTPRSLRPLTRLLHQTSPGHAARPLPFCDRDADQDCVLKIPRNKT